MPHPARAIGWFVRALESVVRWAFPRTEKGGFAAGSLLALLVPVVSLLIPALLLAFAQTIHIALWFAFDSMLCYQLVSTRGLHDAGMRVYSALDKEEHGDLSRARLALSRMTELDTAALNRQDIIKAAVGVIADGATGGVTAPLMFMAAGGGALGVFYRAVSVTASEAGRVKGEFGAASNTLIRLCDFIPSRVAALLMIFSAMILGLDAKSAFRAYRNAIRRGDSPYGENSPVQAACAGTLGIAPGSLRSAQPDDIRLANKLMLFSSLFCVVLLCAVKFAVLCLMLL